MVVLVSIFQIQTTTKKSKGIFHALSSSDSQGKFGLIEMDESDARNNIQTGNIVLHDVAVQVGIDVSTGER